MAGDKRCPKCGAELPPESPHGLCPKCLMAAALESGAATIESPLRNSSAPTSPDSTRFVPPEPASLAAHFPQLEILELLGHGGMGAVYKARQKNLDRLVALKIIRPEAADTPAFAERFNREARMLARLNHPHIVVIYDFGSVDISLREMNPHAEREGHTEPRRLYFFLMEYVDGSSLRQLMRSGDLTPEQALKVVPQICDALQYAHDEGIVHRDIKPENILLDKRGRVKIADFGLAKLAARSSEDFTLTATHHVLGTMRYMAPEQMEGSHAVDHRADIYSLGVVFYEMLTGEVPAGHFEPPSEKVDIDVRLDEVVLRSLAREPERRYQHASDVKTDLESISQTPVTGANAPSGVVEAAPRFSRKAVLGACAVALSVAASIIVLVTVAIEFDLYIARLRAGARGGPPVQWWEYPVMLTLGIAFLSGLIAPFAATILGIVAMREIKDSKGRLVGFGLAFFDAVFCPVLVINAVILAVCFLPAAYIGIATGFDQEAASVLLPLLIVAFPVDILLIRWWWRAAVRDRQLIGSGTERGTSFRRRRLVFTVTLVLPILAIVCAAPLFMAQLNKSRQMVARRDAKSRVEDQVDSPTVDVDLPAPSPASDIQEQPPGPPAPNQEAPPDVRLRSADESEAPPVMQRRSRGDERNGANSVSGRVLYREQGISAEVILEGTDGRQIALVRANTEGRFVLPDVTPGKYTLKARGAARGYIRNGVTEITVLPAPAKLPEVTVKLQ